ncbi:MAG: lysophospholipid acyltransferase family protein [Deltaproteobacteria bacterium]|nr:lysophospholipid acyltransferase family protein [Deltaproteobacteria bacterium]
MLRRRTRKRIKRWLVYVVVRGVAQLLLALPLRAALCLGRGFGRVAHALDRTGRVRARAQLRRAFADPASRVPLGAGAGAGVGVGVGVGEREIRALSARVYANLGMVAVEIGWMGRLRRDIDRYVFLGRAAEETLRAAQAERRGVIFVAGHIGHWELLAQRIAALGFKTATLARSSPNPYLGAWLVRIRGAGGLTTINRGDPGAARQMLATLRSGGLLGILIDQSVPVPSVEVSFFGAPAPTPRVAAELAVRRGIPVAFGWIWRRPEGGHEVGIERVVEDLGASEAMSREARIVALTQRLTTRIETRIRERPADWVWFHDRWRARPAWLPGGPPDSPSESAGEASSDA